MKINLSTHIHSASWKLESAEDKKIKNKNRIRIEKVDEVYTDHFAVYQRYLKETRECY